MAVAEPSGTLSESSPLRKSHGAEPSDTRAGALPGEERGRRKECFDSLSGLQADSLIRHASQSDVEGVTLGDDLNSLLPVEYCYLTDEVLHPFFMQRYVEKRLQQFDSFSHEDTSNPSPEKKRSQLTVLISFV